VFVSDRAAAERAAASHRRSRSSSQSTTRSVSAQNIVWTDPGSALAGAPSSSGVNVRVFARDGPKHTDPAGELLASRVAACLDESARQATDMVHDAAATREMDSKVDRIVRAHEQLTGTLRAEKQVSRHADAFRL
jgi:hypothetical protein